MTQADAFPDFDEDIPAKPIAAEKPKLKVAGAAAEVGVTLTIGLSEDALADSFCTSYNGQWKYVAPWRRWFMWSPDEGWREDRNNRIFQEVREFLRGAAHWDIAGQVTWAGRQKLCSVRHCASVMTFTQTDNRYVANTDLFDNDDMLLGVPGGVVDLRTGELRGNHEKDFITKRCTIRPEAGPHPEWDKFLLFFTSNSQQKQDYLFRLCGMCLSGVRTEQSFTFFFGNGGNGKGVFLRTLMEIMGDYAVGCDADTFMQNKFNSGSEDIARLHGARIAVVDETPKGCVFNEKRIQSVTGGGVITARRLYEASFDFRPKFRLLMAGNYKPVMRATGQAMRRRLHMFPALGSVRVQDQDQGLQNRLREEYPQILAWMIKGFSAWQEHELQPPDEMRQAADAYMESEDTVADWIEDRCTQNGTNRLNRVEAYKDYKRWCAGQGKEHPMGDRAFYEDLELKGFNPGRSAGMRYHLGLELKPDERRWGDAGDE